MNKYDSWLQSGAHSDESEEVWIDDRVTELLNNECNHRTFNNLVEAIGEDCLAKHKDQIEEALQQRDFATLGRLIWSDNLDYWEKQAESWAQDDWRQGFGE